jgi:hypothetical protein
MNTLIATHVGELGFIRFVHDIAALGVLDRPETLAWIALHGALLRLAEPLDDGQGIDEGALEELAHELGSHVEESAA